MQMDAIDYEIVGSDMQYVEVELDPGEAAIAEAGAMLFMEDGIEMETIFGDGSKKQSSFIDKLVGAGKRLVTGEGIFTTAFYHQGRGKRRVAFSAPYPGKIIAIDLKTVGNTLICAKDSFLCGAKGVSLGIAFQKKLGAGFFGGAGFIMQRLEGDGLVFVHAGGTLIHRELRPGIGLRVDTGCVVAFEKSVNFDIKYVGNVKSALFSGEGIFYAQLTGPGSVWLQSLPFEKLVGKISSYLPTSGSGSSLTGSLTSSALSPNGDGSGLAGSLVSSLFNKD